MEASTTLKRNNRGTTLAEMIVTFALAGIFMVSAAAVISSAILMYSELNAVMYAESVGEMLLDKVTGELAGAQDKGGQSMKLTEASQTGETTGDSVSFYDRDGREAALYVKDGRLILHYGELVTVADNGEVLTSPAQDWQFDDKAYMGYRIKDIGIEQLSKTNVIEVTITLQNLKTGFEYSTTRCTGCYHFNEWRE